MPDSTNTFGGPVPVFRVKDVDASVAYYLNALGFKLQWRASDGFACVARDKCSIFLTSDSQSQPRMWVWIGVPDVRALHAAFVKSGAKIRNPPENFEWALEMQIEDLDGVPSCLFSVRAAAAFPARRNITKSNQIDVIAFAVLCNLQQIEYSKEAGFPRQFRSNVRKPDGCDRLDFYLAVSHAIAAAFRDMGPGPNPDAASYVAANHPFAKTLCKDHGLL